MNELKANRPTGMSKLVHPNLYNFVYFDKSTLLASATRNRMLRYCKLLVFSGFDMNYMCEEQGVDETAWELSKLYPSSVRPYFESILMHPDNYHDPKTVETSFYSLKKQTRFGDLFCHYLGCFDEKDENINDRDDPSSGANPLYYNYSHCQNIIKCVKMC